MKLIPEQLSLDSPYANIDAIRRIYNVTIPTLATKPLKPNTWEEQLDWWNHMDWSRTKFFVFYPVQYPGLIVAFSRITDHGDYCTPMIAVDPEWQHHGYGQEIIRHYLRTAYPKPMRATALSSNLRVCLLNSLAGWQVEAHVDGVYQLYHPNKRESDAVQP